uniref:uncharacterized protein LOC120345143 n=1 Tax=Styela clava TaxID=7725 RepID=UPI00193AC692|nr:uncharacterized protein LOC120345143 [Styela clava]
MSRLTMRHGLLKDWKIRITQHYYNFKYNVTSWTNRAVDIVTNQLLLASGGPTSIATEVWYPGYPQSQASWTNVGVDVNKDPEFSRQGMYHDKPSSSRQGIICEI